MEPRMWRSLIAVVILLLLALAAFTLLLRRYQSELRARPGNRPASRLVRPPGAPPLPAHVRQHMEQEGVTVETPPAATTIVVGGVGQVDVQGTANP